MTAILFTREITELSQLVVISILKVTWLVKSDALAKELEHDAVMVADQVPNSSAASVSTYILDWAVSRVIKETVERTPFFISYKEYVKL
jgi:hypothetical protein